MPLEAAGCVGGDAIGVADKPDSEEIPGRAFEASNRGAGGGTLFLAGGGIDSWLWSLTWLLESFEASERLSVFSFSSSMLSSPQLEFCNLYDGAMRQVSQQAKWSVMLPASPQYMIREYIYFEPKNYQIFLIRGESRLDRDIFKGLITRLAGPCNMQRGLSVARMFRSSSHEVTHTKSCSCNKPVS